MSAVVNEKREGVERGDAAEKSEDLDDLEEFMAKLYLDCKTNPELSENGKALFATERRGFREFVFSHHIEANSTEFLILTIHRTAYRRLSMTLNLLEGYPRTLLNLELKSKLLPEKLLEKLKKKCEGDVMKPLSAEGKPQAIAAYLFLYDIITSNKLLFATPEIRQLKNILASEKYGGGNGKAGSTMSCNDKDGVIKIKLVNGEYYQRVTISVPDEYPASPIDVEFGSSSFPEQVSSIYYNQVREISRKIAQGIKAEDAVRSSDPTDTSSKRSSAGKSEPPPVRMTSAYLLGLKHDVKTLKQATDLEKVNSGYNKQLHKHDHSTETRRRARRELKKLNKDEADKEQKRVNKLTCELRLEEEWRILERAQLRAVSTKDSGPKRSIRACVEFLLDEYVFKLPQVLCPTTQRKCFPKSPKELKEMYAKRSKLRPIRASCGCWFGYQELNKFLTEPPFGASCVNPECNGAKVFHKDWPTDIKRLEKQWAMKKAREREINEIADCFALGDEFSK